MKILLSSVFGPFGVDDAYGRKENVMELFHNQVTREQGLFSMRFNHQSFGLYFLAENLKTPAVVLDFPTEAEFVREIKKGYDYVGVSFITPNFVKAKRMAELVRKHAPASKIVLGGHGTMIPGVERMIEHDFICRGEGVVWLRRLLGEDIHAPFKHPALPSSFNKRILGLPLPTDAAVLVPGVGCPNACRFCATSHFFDRTYTPYFDTGQQLFDICHEIEKKTGFREFFVMDENFLKRPERARELAALMEKHHKLYRFGLFSSAETLSKVGIDLVARLGVYFLWLGVESKQEVYEKNRGVDMKGLIRELRAHAVSVLASGILFLEQHDHETIWDDIRFLVDLESDFVQFMQLGPLPLTKLYQDYDARSLLRHDVPFEEWHGQHRIWFRHPSFTPEESERLLKAAFRHDYDEQGPSLLRMCDTTLRGYTTFAKYTDPFMQARRAELKELAQHLRPTLRTLVSAAHNARARAIALEVERRYEEVLGPLTVTQRVQSRVLQGSAFLESWRVATGRHRYQPKTLRTAYREPPLGRLLPQPLPTGAGPTGFTQPTADGGTA
jgi:radical SAM superfamily enzyme YgiQ (UPF0313 family)